MEARRRKNDGQLKTSYQFLNKKNGKDNSVFAVVK